MRRGECRRHAFSPGYDAALRDERIAGGRRAREPFCPQRPAASVALAEATRRRLALPSGTRTSLEVPAIEGPHRAGGAAHGPMWEQLASPQAQARPAGIGPASRPSPTGA